MVNLDLLFAVVFYGLILIWFFKKRDKFEVQGKIIALYKTQIGVKLMDRLAKISPRLTNVVGHLGTIVGFLGMGTIFYFLIKGTVDLLLVPDAMPAVAPVLPGVRIPGLPVMSFWHWILGIFFVATVHEFSHGIWARLYKIKIKSSGVLFFGPILGAFVEPDEKQLAKKPKSQQLAVFAAGPFSNIVFGFVFLAIMSFVTGPIFGDMYNGAGIEVHDIMENYPAAEAGIEAPIVIESINGAKTEGLQSFVHATQGIKPDDTVELLTDKGTYTVTTVANPDNASKGFIGIADFGVKTELKESVVASYGTFLPNAFEWTHMLVFWLMIINFGIGLFNLLPLGPVDGGRMFLTGMEAIFPRNKKRAAKVWGFVSFFCLALIVINLAPYLWQLIVWLFKPIMMLGAFLG